MTQEDKDLLFKDLSARLPYSELMVQYKGEDFNIINIGFGRVTLIKPFMSITSGSPLIDEIKPYLRPMSSMTEDEYEELEEISHYYGFAPFEYIDDWGPNYDMTDWLNKHHFDYRGLIEKGLALEALEGMYK